MKFLRQRSRFLPASFLAALTLYLLFSFHHTSPSPRHEPTLEILPWTPNTPPHIAIAVVSPPNTNARSLALWSGYASRFDHQLYIQHSPIIRGFANPLLWLHHLIASELMKDSNRAEWIVSIDPSLTLPCPVHTHQVSLNHFLPSTSSPIYTTLTIIGTKPNGVDMATSLVYIRVSSLSLRILTLAMAAVHLAPQRDWGEDGAGAVLRDVLERQGYGDKVVWVPGEWWGGVFVKTHVGEGGRGTLQREEVLAGAETRMNGTGGDAVPGKQEVEAFWGLVGEARSVLDVAKAMEHVAGEQIKGLRDVVELRTWDTRALVGAMDTLKEKLGLGKLVGFDSAVG